MPESAAKPQVSRQPKIDGVARIIAVASGKGGVGKSTVAANLAVALRALGRRVGLADVDIYGPSAPIMFGIHELPHPDENSRLLQPLESCGVKIMSMGFFLDEQAPVVWRGPMAMSATKQFLRGVAWGDLDYLIVDLPPGTGDIPLTLAQEVPLDGGIIVTTPQDVAMADVTRGVAMFRRVNTPILGAVINMAGYTCGKCGALDEIFGSRPTEQVASEIGAPVLCQLPIEQKIRECGDAGRPLVTMDPSAPVSRAFLDLAAAVEGSLARVREELYGPEPVDVTIDDSSSSVSIRWSDGPTTRYSFKGLRGWCPCASCQGHSSLTRFIETESPRPTGHEGVGRYALRFLWADGHSTGMYSYSWLREIAEFPECRAN